MLNSEKNICFVNTTKAWGGGEKWHFDNSAYLSNKNYNVFFVAHKNGILSTKLDVENINAELVKVGNSSFLNPFKILKLCRYYKRNNIKILVINMPADLKLSGVAAKLAGVEKIIYRRGSAIPIKNRFLNRILLKNIVTHILANSKKTKETILSIKDKLINPEKIKVIYNGIDLNKFEVKRNEKAENNIIVIGNVGRLVYQKGQEYLLDLAVILREKKIPFRIKIGGSGPRQEMLTKRIKELELESEVELTGFCDNISQFMSDIDVFFLSSRWEGFGYVIAEAMACRKPVIAFDISSNPELIEHKHTGFLIKPFDLNVAAERIEKLFNNRELLNQLGENGFNKVVKEFDSKVILKKVENYLFE